MSVWKKEIRAEDIYGPFQAGKSAADYMAVQLVTFDEQGQPEAPVTVPFRNYLGSSAATADEFVKARHAVATGNQR
jgi:hypothetical protein